MGGGFKSLSHISVGEELRDQNLESECLCSNSDSATSLVSEAKYLISVPVFSFIKWE